MYGYGSSSVAAASESSSSSSFSLESSQQQQGQQQIALGLNLGFETKNPSEKYDGLCWGHQHFMPLPASSSSLSAIMLCRSTSSMLPNSAFSNLPDDDHSLVPNVAHHNYIQRPSPGIWFTLRATINRNGEVLPQIPKAYMRVKDENVTVLMVKTYLVRKLGLSNEAEVEIWCMGQTLTHSLTMRHVRDAIWLPKLVEFLDSNPTFVQNSHSTTMHHLMSLDYGRCSLFNEVL